MKRLFILLLVAIPAGSFSQVELDQLTAPTSPASAITGAQPATILAPKSYQALETALYNNFTSDGNVIIPKDFALEFTPYWTKDHGLKQDEYLYPTLLKALARNSSLSVASTQTFQLGDSTETYGLGFGYRTTFFIPFSGDREMVKRYQDSVGTLTKFRNTLGIAVTDLLFNQNADKKKFLDGIKTATSEVILSLNYARNKAEADSLTAVIIKDAQSKLPEPTTENSNDFMETFYSIAESHLKQSTAFDGFKSYLKIRRGISVDLAYANFTNFPTNDLEFSYVPKQAFWLTPNIRWTNGKNALKVLAVYRYEWYNTHYYESYFPGKQVFKNNHDFGLAVAGEFKKFSIQLEYSYRSRNSMTPVAVDANGNDLYRIDRDSDSQYLFTFSYSMTDNMVLTYTLGSRFEDAITPKNSLVSLLTLNFGFGTPPVEIK